MTPQALKKLLTITLPVSAYGLLISVMVLTLIQPVIGAESKPLLKRQAVVSADIVTFGDLFDEAGLKAETPVFYAPKPGMRGTVSADDITQALRQAGIEAYDLAGLNEIYVERPGFEITQDDLLSLLEDRLAERLQASVDDLEVQLSVPFQGLVIPASQVQAGFDDAVAVQSLSLVNTTGRFQAVLTVAGHGTHTLSGQVRRFTHVPVLTRTMARGDRLVEGDVELARVTVSRQQKVVENLPSVNDFIGQELKRSMRAGSAVALSDVSAPMMVERNEEVTLIYRSGPLMLTVLGRALAAGAKGETITVMNNQTRRTLSGTIVQPGLVQINSSSIRVADLNQKVAL
jgi:flagella basal body P-ring formation protein FlgA